MFGKYPPQPLCRTAVRQMARFPQENYRRKMHTTVWEFCSHTNGFLFELSACENYACENFGLSLCNFLVLPHTVIVITRAILYQTESYLGRPQNLNRLQNGTHRVTTVCTVCCGWVSQRDCCWDPSSLFKLSWWGHEPQKRYICQLYRSAGNFCCCI